MRTGNPLATYLLIKMETQNLNVDHIYFHLENIARWMDSGTRNG